MIAFSIIVLFNTNSTAQNLNTQPVVKGDYKTLKLDLLSLMGLGTQKLHVSYETSVLKSSKGSLPTLNFNLNIPLNSSSQDLNIQYGAEIGAELRFYQVKRHQNIPIAEGLFGGIGIDGGFVKLIDIKPITTPLYKHLKNQMLSITAYEQAYIF